MILDYIENLKIIQEMKNKVHFINNKIDKTEVEDKKIKMLKESLTSLSEYYFSQIPDCKKIQIIEKTIIRKGEIIKLKTNIDEINLDKYELIFDGYVPMDECLVLYTAKDETDKTNLYAKNNTPDNEKNKFVQYEFCDNDTSITRLSGNIEIKKGSIIGILIPKENVKQKRKSRDY